MNQKLPTGWDKVAGRVLPKGAAASRARAADPAPPPPEKKDPPKEDPAAADPIKCAKCDAEVPSMEPPAKFCPQCGAPMDGSSEGAPKPAEGEPAKAAAFAQHALLLTGDASYDGARGTLAAWKESAAQVVAANARVEVLERERLLERAVGEGKIDPAEAWTFSAGKDGQKVRSFSAWAGPPNAQTGEGQTLAQLTAYIAKRSRAAGPGPARSSTLLTPGKPEASTPPAPPGIKPEIYAAARRQVAELTGGENT